MVTGIGIDLVEISRLETLYKKLGEKFLRRVFTVSERQYILAKKNPYPSMAARFAAKEAVFKALNLRDRGVSWQDIEVISLPRGAPSLSLRGGAAQQAKKNKVRKILISLTHSKEIAAAFVCVVK